MEVTTEIRAADLAVRNALITHFSLIDYSTHFQCPLLLSPCLPNRLIPGLISLEIITEQIKIEGKTQQIPLIHSL